MMFAFKQQVISLSYFRLFSYFSLVVLLAFCCELWLEPQLVYYFFPGGKCASAIHEAIISLGRLTPVMNAYASDLLACLEVISCLGFLVVLVGKVYYSILTFYSRR